MTTLPPSLNPPPFRGQAPGPARRPGHIQRISTFFANFRWLFMPLGLFALVAVGVHAAADTLDDRVLRLLDSLDAVFDGFVAQYEPTQSWVHWVGDGQRTELARGVVLLWELIADFILAVPALGYEEAARPRPGRSSLRLAIESKTWPVLLRRVKDRPNALRILRPLMTGAVAVAGACAVARMVQGALYLSMRQGIADEAAGPVARGLAITVLIAILASFGWRAVLRSLQAADDDSEEKRLRGRRAWTAGLWGSAVALPLAVAAVVDAAPVASFFR